MVYDLTPVANSTNTVKYLIAVNEVSGGYLFSGLLGAIWVILFVSLKLYETEDAITASTFFVFVIALFMRFAPGDPMIGDGVFYFWVSAMLLSVIVSYISRNM